MHTRSLALWGLLAGLAAVSARGADGSSPPSAPAAGAPKQALEHAREALARLQARSERLRDNERLARRRLASAPPYFSRELERLRNEGRAALRGAVGHPWAEARPVLDREARLRRTLDTIAAEVGAWAPTVRPGASAVGLLTGTGVVTGRVTDAVTGAPVTDATVFISSPVPGQNGSAHVDASGRYTVTGLTAASYYGIAQSDGYNDELYDDIPCELTCQTNEGRPIPVADGTTVEANFALLRLSTLEGTVTDGANAVPVPDADVDVYDADDHWLGTAPTGPDGHYRVERLPFGTYFARVIHPYYLDQLYDGLPCEPDCQHHLGTPIAVPGDTHVGGIDFALLPGGSIAGTVDEAATGRGLENVRLEVYDTAGQPVSYTTSQADGRYFAGDLPPGNYFVRTFTIDHADQLFDRLPCEPDCDPVSGTPVVVAQGQTRGGVDFSLARLGTISGRVSAAGTLLPRAEARVEAVRSDGMFVGFAYTDTQGLFRVGPLADGSYHVIARDPLYLDELYDDLPCDPSCDPGSGAALAVAAGSDVSGVDFTLTRGGSVRGTITDHLSGQPIPFAVVRGYRANGSEAGEAGTSAVGTYSVDDLATGPYYAIASDFGGHQSELYQDLPCGSGCDPVTGTPIPVTASQATGGVDFDLHRLGEIRGRVVDRSTGIPVSGYVMIHDASGPQRTASTHAGGYFSVPGLTPGTYHALTVSFDNHVDELYDGRTCEPTCDPGTGTAIPVALDTVTSNIDFALRRPVFADVPVDHFAWRWVEALYAAGVTGGCGTAPLRFCPNDSASRGEMAVFLLRSKEGPAYIAPPAQGLFSDLPVTNPFASWAEELFRRGITGGCGTNPLRYCPTAATTRAQMAPFLLLTKEGTGYMPAPATGVFQDVPASDPFARWVEELVRRHVANGCSVYPPLFCAGQSTTRAQMAVFLVSTFGLALP